MACLVTALFAVWATLIIRGPLPDEWAIVNVTINGAVRPVCMEMFHAPGDTSYGRPAVVLLHGVEGANRFVRARRHTADMFRDQGYHVFVVHYFDTVAYDNLYLLTPSGEIDTTIVERYIAQDQEKWSSAITTAIESIRQRADVHDEKIAIVGYSLGGFLALDAAERCRTHGPSSGVQGVVVNWGACFTDENFGSGYPPTFFVHGECDRTVPLQWTRQTMARLRAVNTDVELYVVPRAPHVAISAEANLRMLAFLKTYLSG